MTTNLGEQPTTDQQIAILGGLPVRTDLHGGTCVEVNDEVNAALQTLTSALSGTAAAVPVGTKSSTTTGS